MTTSAGIYLIYALTDGRLNLDRVRS